MADQNHDQGQRNIGEGAKPPPQHEQQDQNKYQPGHGRRVPDQGGHTGDKDGSRKGGKE